MFLEKQVQLWKNRAEGGFFEDDKRTSCHFQGQ
jgi:hypothetical protein